MQVATVQKTIPFNFHPRVYQLDLLESLDSGIKRAVVVWPRRHGKDKVVFCWCLSQLWRAVPITCYYCLPEYSHGRKVIWDNIDNDGFKLLNHIPPEAIESINKQEMKITFKNGSLFQVVGADNYDKLVGANPHIIVYSEYGITDPKAWDFLRPIIRQNKGTAIFIGTPRGKNHFYELFKMARDNDEWFCQILSNDDTHLLSDDDLERERREGMSEEMIQQEYFCSFEGLIEGSIYGNYLGAAEKENRITHVPYDPQHLVHTAWDIGLDATSVVFFQLVGNQINFIDHYEAKNTAMTNSVHEVLNRKYHYGEHFHPHDGRNRSVLTGTAFTDIAEQLGLKMSPIEKEGSHSILGGIEVTKGLFPRMFFDKTKCEYLISCIQSYQTEYDDKLKKYRDQPLHNWASHANDSLRYASLAIKNNLITGQEKSEWSEIKSKYNYYGNLQQATQFPSFMGNRQL